MSDQQGRTASFSRNQALEALLSDVNLSLSVAEQQLLGKYGCAEYPLVLVMGPLRSGTTLFTQWLANTGALAYPTNLLSRFYQAPILGAKIQLLLTDERYNFRNELGELVREVRYESENGKTRGVLAPNEFWYFWRRFLPDPARDVWTDEELSAGVDAASLRAELNGMASVFAKPFVLKAMLFNYNIGFLSRLLEKVIFVQVRRDPVSNVASILDARNRQFGTTDRWYSFDIPEYGELKDLSPAEQAAGQVFYINSAIDAGLAGVTDDRKLIVDYEAFCEAPASVYEALVTKLAQQGCTVSDAYAGEPGFHKTRQAAIDPAVVAACRKYYG